MLTKTSRYDTAEYLDSEEKIAAYMDAVLEQGDAALLTYALEVAARARRMPLNPS
jgi:probable addiction module antidote protein